MKKIILLLALVYFIMPMHIYAQYSNASLNGTWIADGDGLSFVSFNGNGTIIMVGTSDDSVQPVGTYSVTPSGAISAALHFVEGTQTVTGQMFNDSSASLRDTS